MAPDYLKLFLDKRLSPKEPHHLEYIKGRLANMKFDDPTHYGEYADYYGVDVGVQVVKEPVKETKKVVEAPKKKVK